MLSRHFSVAQFLGFLLPGTAFAVFDFLNRLVDTIIVGHVIGEDAFAGVNMVSSSMSFVAFFAALVSIGMTTNYSICMGRMDRHRARCFFMQGLWMTLFFGSALSLALLVGEDAYLDLLGGAEFVEMYARQYMDWIWLYGIVHCLLMFLSLFACVDGDIRLCSIAYVIVFIVNIAISYVSVTGGMGASGCALGTVISEGVGMLLLSAHFFRKSNTFHPVGHFSWMDSYDIVRASFGDAATFLCNSALFFILCKAVIDRFGSDYVPIAGIAIIILRFSEIFNGIGFAVQPLVTVYWGEGNIRGVRKVMQAAMSAAPLEGLLLVAIFGAFPDLIVNLAGVEYDDLVGASRTCVRLTCCGLIPIAVASLFKSYYLFIERPAFSLGMSLACYLLFPSVGIFAGASLGGLNGVWAGLSFGQLAGVAAMALAVFIHQGSHGFPCLLPAERAEKIKMIDLMLTEADIVSASSEVATLLPDGISQRAALMVEEVFMTVRERNPRRRRLMGEITLDFSDGIVMTLRDNGIIFDITDADAKISSLRTYLVASVMERQRERTNLITTGFNRNVFRFA